MLSVSLRMCVPLALACIVCVWPTCPVRADQPNRAAVVVRFDDGRVESRCVEFTEESTAGSELLARSGLTVLADSSSGLGITVCKIQGLGCDYPASPCFCECMGGGTCRYWNYYYRDPGQEEWQYSPLGALLRQVRPGSVEAWVWGDGHTPPAADITFEAVCPPSAPAQGGVALARDASPETGAEPSAGPTLPPEVPAQESQAAFSPSPGVYWPFGLMILILIGVAVYFRLLRR